MKNLDYFFFLTIFKYLSVKLIHYHFNELKICFHFTEMLFATIPKGISYSGS